MHQNAKFWILLAIFEVVFGGAIFAITRHVYIADAIGVGVYEGTDSEALQEWTSENQQSNSAMLDALISLPATTSEDPAEIFRLANVYFADKRYDKAAVQYERLLSIDPTSADIHNNLGITWHYLGRSAEALRVLDEGIAVDPTNQRIWLTLGFVHKEVGNIDEARAALATATQMGPENEVGASAARMLEELP
jgi:Flp pilus assembly protein TadD